METSDLSQPHGLPDGRFEAPRPRKIVFPVFVSMLYLNWLWWACSEVGRGELAGRTCLHGQETRPGIVGGRVTETGDEAEDKTEDVCVSGRDGL